MLHNFSLCSVHVDRQICLLQLAQHFPWGKDKEVYGIAVFSMALQIKLWTSWPLFAKYVTNVVRIRSRQCSNFHSQNTKNFKHKLFFMCVMQKHISKHVWDEICFFPNTHIQKLFVFCGLFCSTNINNISSNDAEIRVVIFN